MHRRRFLVASGALAAFARQARADALDLRAAAREAWLYGLPLIEMAGARARMTGVATGAAPVGVNAFVHSRDLAGPRSRGVTTPNNDTLYSSAWLDLSGGPQTITLPATGQRYFSLALMDMYTNVFAVLGTRTTGPDRGAYSVVGPRDAGPRDALRSPTPWVWALARTLVDGAADLDAAHAIQDQLSVRGRRGRSPRPAVGRDAVWNDYFFAVQQLIEENPPPATDVGFFHDIAAMQVGMKGGFEQARFGDSEEADIAAGIGDAHALLADENAGQQAEGGWLYPRADQGDFAQDYHYRAAAALRGLAALPPVEAMYMRALSPSRAPTFSGEGRYRLTLPGPIPVNGFWSLTMYEAAGGGQLFLTDNPIDRYSIGDRTPGLRRGPDGAIDIWIARTDPGEERRANWLPAPAAGPFALILRAYLPKPELLGGSYRLPPVLRAEEPSAPTPPPQPAPPAPKRRRRTRLRPLSH
ncbi:MAG: DUF1254 domain-containing protein [Caulobacterales bacterium]